jgi:DNA repair protein RecN (Recombination protein N)
VTLFVLFKRQQWQHRTRMLSSLRIQNLALIGTAHLELGAGLSVLTGESGSGKSILLDALALVTGASRPRIKVRSGCSSGFVEAEFLPHVDDDGQLTSADLHSALEEHDLLEACLGPGEPIILTRRIDVSGRSRCFIQGQTVTRAALTRVGSCLLELCGQSEAHNLRTGTAQLAALDRFAHLVQKQRQVSSLVQQLRQRECEERRILELCAEAERRRDFLEFQLNELKEMDLSELAERRQRLDELSAATAGLGDHQELVSELEGGNDGVLPRLKMLSSRLSHGLRDDPDGILSTAIGDLDAATTLLQGALRASRILLSNSDRLREEVELLKGQFSVLRDAARKHRTTIDELPARRDELSAELLRCAELEQEAQKARADTQLACAVAQRAADQLHQSRLHAARRLDKKMAHELERVGLSGAHFETCVHEGDLGPTGTTQVEYLFSANLGHQPEALSRVASGGELSRVLLCFRLATESAGAMLVFDEIDAGVGGQTAEKIAASLKRAAESAQVLCVTHWPQVAGVADRHFSVTKTVVEGTTESTVVAVSGDDRVGEIGRMLGGATKTAREHASALVRASVAP